MNIIKLNNYYNNYSRIRNFDINTTTNMFFSYTTIKIKFDNYYMNFSGWGFTENSSKENAARKAVKFIEDQRAWYRSHTHC